MNKSYSELIKFDSLRDRFLYLKLGGSVGFETFGGKRYLNQQFYKSEEYRKFRLRIIERDDGFELGCKDSPIKGKIYIHHINPISEQDILGHSPLLLDEENAISCSFLMHNAIHYGDERLIPEPWEPRTPNDTIPWR